MPCYLCGSRQGDPACGAAPWIRGVRHDRQVLVCPECVLVEDWKADLDRCARCRSTFLISRLGEVECHTCGAVRGQCATLLSGPLAPAPDPALTDEVEQALSRELGAFLRAAPPRTDPSQVGR